MLQIIIRLSLLLLGVAWSAEMGQAQWPFSHVPPIPIFLPTCSFQLKELQYLCTTTRVLAVVGIPKLYSTVMEKEQNQGS